MFSFRSWWKGAETIRLEPRERNCSIGFDMERPVTCHSQSLQSRIVLRIGACVLEFDLGLNLGLVIYYPCDIDPASKS